MPAKKKKSFPVCVCIIIIHRSRKRKKRKDGQVKKKVKKQNKKMRKRSEANIQSFSTNCDQMSFFEKRKRERKNMISIVFETNIIKQTSGVTIELTVKMNKFTQTVTRTTSTTTILFLTFNISLSICAH